MDAPEQPQIYLITPPSFALDTFPDQLAKVLDGADIACLRLDLASQDEDELSRAADAVRAVAHDRDVAVVISHHVVLCERLGLDGVHLTETGRIIRDTRKTLGTDAIVGSFCGGSRHNGISAAEAGVDYVSFGPVANTGLGSGEVAETELFEWWSDMIEIPVVAEGGLSPEHVARLAGMTDFFAFGPEIWSAPDPSGALKTLTERFQG
ncbi:MAG: thiamine phosphate synthase [Sedimentitalea sp.]